MAGDTGSGLSKQDDKQRKAVQVAREKVKGQGKEAENRATRRALEDPDAVIRESEGASQLGTIKIAGVPASSSTVLSYPSAHRISKTSDYISFEFFRYKPPFAGSATDKEATTNLGNAYSSSADFGSGNEILGEKVNTCLMYMPEDIQAEYGANWGGAGFGLLTREAIRTGAGDFDLTRAFEAGVGAGQKAVIDTIVKAWNGAMGSSVTTNQVTAGTKGVVVNPNVEMMYEAPEMRGFSLQFKLTPVNAKEAASIKAICNMFKKSMLPRYGNAFVQVPDVVRVTFMSGSEPNPYISQFKPCAITNVSINSTAEGAWAAYQNGAPVSTTLSIQFKELKMLFSDEINDQGPTY